VSLYEHKKSDDLIAVKEYNLQPNRGISSVAYQECQREIESLIKLDHPCIVRLIGFGPPSGRCGDRVAMPYIESGSLGNVLDANPPPPWLTDTVKTGMIFVHSAGIIHRDLSRGNILLDEVTHCSRISNFATSRFE
jgi:serine/threonine protein kinase